MITPFDFYEITKKIQSNLYQGTSKKLLNKAHGNLTSFGNRLVKKNQNISKNVLEIGAGSGELFEHVNKDFENYFMTDISDWGKKDILDLALRDQRIKFEIQDVEKLSYPEDYFERVLVSCVIAHVTEPYQALLELRRVTKPGGIISIFVSTDPGILLKLIRNILTKPRMSNLPIPYELCNSIQHRNTPSSIMEMTRWIFKEDYVKINYYPFRIKSWNLSTHLIINIVKK